MKKCLHTRGLPLVLLFSLGFALLAQQVYAQQRNLVFEQMSTDQGLSQSTATSVLQDRFGFIWVGTLDGLNRYDGYGVTVYRNDPADAMSLSDNNIQALFEDTRGTLWIGTHSGGLNALVSETPPADEDADPDKSPAKNSSTDAALPAEFRRYRLNPQDTTTLSSDAVNAIHETRSGLLLIGTAGGLNGFDPSRNVFLRFDLVTPAASAPVAGNVLSILEDGARPGQVWLGTEKNGLFRIAVHPEGADVLVQFTHDAQDSTTLGAGAVTALHQDGTGRLWVGTSNGGLSRLDPTTGTFARLENNPDDPASLSHNGVSALFEDRAGDFWVGTQSGLCRLRQDAGAATFFDRYLPDPANPGSIGDDQILAITEDHAGILWVGTGQAGLNKMNSENGMFRSYRNDPRVPENLSHNYVNGMSEAASGEIWIATSGGGLNRFDPGTGKFVHYRHSPEDNGSLPSDEVYAVYEDSDRNVWIGSGAGLTKMRERPGKKPQFSHFRHDPEDSTSLSHNLVVTIRPGTDGTLWIGTLGGGINQFDPRGSTFKRYQHDPVDPLSLSSNQVQTLLIDSDSTLWIGTNNGGLCRLDTDSTGSVYFTRFMHDPFDSTSLSHNIIQSLHEDRARRLWIGTRGGGLNQFVRRTGRFAAWRESDGLANDVVYGILEDDHGLLWVSTNRGLSKFDPRSGVFEKFDVTDGLQSNEFNRWAYLKTSDGACLFGGANGFNIFYPQYVRRNLSPPKVALTLVKVDDVPVRLGRDAARLEALELNYLDDHLSFEFAGLHFDNPARNQYSYVLEGVDRGWIQSGQRRFANYTNLAPGRYVFRVNAANSDGIWNVDGAAVAIEIQPPFWQSWWFRALAAIAFSGLLVAGHRVRVRHIRRQKRKLERLIHERTAELEEKKQALQLARDGLEKRVADRTAKLRDEIVERVIAEQALRKSQEALRNLTAHLESVREQERTTVAREIHDELGQLLSLATIQLTRLPKEHPTLAPEAVSEIESLKELMNSGVETIQRISSDLRPHILDALGLVAAIEWHAGNFQEKTAIRCILNDPPDDVEVEKRAATAMFRIVQEALTNVMRHADAARVEISLFFEPDAMRLIIEDDGKGITPGQIEDAMSIGLIGMRERVRPLGGVIDITGIENEGTRIVVRLPGRHVIRRNREAEPPRNRLRSITARDPA